MSPRALSLRATLFAVAALAVAAVGGWLLFGRGPLPIQTDLMAMLPATERNPLAEEAAHRLARAQGDRVVLLVENADADRADAAARALGTALKTDGAFVDVIATLPPFDPHDLSAPYLPHRFFLLSAADRDALAGPGYDAAQALAEHLNAPLLGNALTRLQDDPFGWLQDWLQQQPWNRSALTPEEGLLTAHHDGITAVLVTARLRGSAYDADVQQHALAALDAAWGRVAQAHPGSRLLRTGMLFYASAARERAAHDLHMVGWISSLGIALLLLAMFRSPRPLLLAFVSTAVGIASATTATLLVFGRIELLTVVFGAALLGEAVDYSIQYLAARANAGADWQPVRGLRQVRPALLLALVTSLMGYALMGVVPFPALRQMACFAGVGMVAACLSVFALLPALLRRPGKPLSAPLVRGAYALQQRVAALGRGRRVWALAALLVLLAVPGWQRLGHDDDVHLLATPPAGLLAQEAKIRTLTGFGNGNQFFLVQGDSSEQALEREEALDARLRHAVAGGALHDFIGIAPMLPSLRRQRRDHALLAPLFADAAHARTLLTNAGLRAKAADAYVSAWPGTPLTLDAWLKLPVSRPFRQQWLGCGAHGCGLVVLPQGITDIAALRAAAAGLPGVTLVDKAASVSRLLGRYRHYARLWLLGALLLLAPVFAWRYGLRRGARVMMPPLLGIGLALAALGYLGQPLTLFHWLALMLVLGVGANYAVFLHEGEPHSRHRPGAMYAVVLLSAVTAVLSFGLLALSSMPALRDFGLTLLFGITATALLVPASRDGGAEHAA